jgi:hypothetical protein
VLVTALGSVLRKLVPRGHTFPNTTCQLHVISTLPNTEHEIYKLLIESSATLLWVRCAVHSLAAWDENRSLLRLSFEINYAKPTVMRHFINSGVEGEIIDY